jgi:hypothetical protein
MALRPGTMPEITLRQIMVGVLAIAITLAVMVGAISSLNPPQIADISPDQEAGQLLNLEMGVSAEMDQGNEVDP